MGCEGAERIAMTPGPYPQTLRAKDLTGACGGRGWRHQNLTPIPADAEVFALLARPMPMLTVTRGNGRLR